MAGGEEAALERPANRVVLQCIARQQQFGNIARVVHTRCNVYCDQ